MDKHINAQKTEPQMLECPAAAVADMCLVIAVSADWSGLNQIAMVWTVMLLPSEALSILSSRLPVTSKLCKCSAVLLYWSMAVPALFSVVTKT